MFVYVGGYTSEDRQGRGDGINLYEVTEGGASWRHAQRLETAENPSMLRISPDGTRLYAAHGARTTISAYTIDADDGRIAPLSGADSGGINPVDLGFSADGWFLITANYTAGTVAVLPIGSDGALSDAQQAVALSRPGYEADPLPHGVTFDASKRFVLIPDKGLDCVFVFRVTDNGELVAADTAYAACESGSGPRHAAFHPALPILYVVTELSCTVEVFRWNAIDGKLDQVQRVSALAPGTGGANHCAEIVVSADGRSIYASVRGDNSIAWFQADPATGLLSDAHRVPCGGKEPRYFTISPDNCRLVVANQESDTIVSLPLNATGRPGDAEPLARVGSPSTVVFGRRA